MKETDNELQDFNERSESNDISSSSNTENNLLPAQKEGGRLRSIQSLLGQEVEEIEDADNPKLQSIDSILRNDSEVLNYNISDDYGSNDMVLAKYLYITKDFVYMLILLLSSGFNFGWLYFPFLLLSFISYFLLFKSTRFTKRFKKIIEIISLVYALALLGIKIYLVVEEPTNLLDIFINFEKTLIGKEFKDSTFDIVRIFLGESLVIIFSIASLIISYICTDFNCSEQIQKNRNMKEEDFYWLMDKCIYFAYFMIVGFAIFNRSILTLCYILPMNIILFFLSMNSNKKLLFYIYKIISVIMIFAITAQIILINIFNVKSISESFDYQNIASENQICFYNFYTQLGINQADNCRIKENNEYVVDKENIFIQYFAYFFAICSLLSLIFSYKKLSKERLNQAIQNSLNQEDIVELEEQNKNGCIKVLEKIKDYFFSPNFILHICRISAILWLYSYQNFYSIGIFIWLFFSFLFMHIKSNKFFTIVFLAPMVIICLFCYHFSNIDGFIDEDNKDPFKSRFGIAKFKNKYIEYILCNIFYFLTTLFIYALFIREERKEQEKLKEIKKVEHSKQLQNELYNDNKDDNINNENIENKENIDNNINYNYNFNISSQDGIAIGLLPTPNENNYVDDLENVKLELNDKEIDELYNNLTLFNIILKTLFSNIDKITLVFLYILTVNSINIIHGALTLVFMIQLLFPIFMIKNSIIMLILSQIIFLFEYIVDLFKNTKIFKDNIDIIELIIPFEPEPKTSSIEFLIYIITYCYYTQYQLYNYDFYQKIAYDDNLCLSIFIEIKLSDYPIIRKILFGIGKIIMELYIWTLIAIFIVIDSYFEISFLFAIKLFIFFIIVYKFLRVIQSNKPSHISQILNWFFLIFCSLNTIAVYVFQVLFLKSFSFSSMIKSSDNFFINNFPAIGFYRYKNKSDNLHYRFLPHFISNFISVLFIGEMKRILNEDKLNNKKKEGGINSDQINNTKNKLLLKKKTIMKDNRKNNKKEEKEKEGEKEEREEKEKDEDKSIDKNNKIISTDSETNDENKLNNIDEIKEVDEGVEENDNDSSKLEDKKKEEEEVKLTPTEEYENNKRSMNILEYKYYFYNFLLIFTKFYWLFLFFSICIIFTAYDLSIVLIIYILIFGITFIRMFRHIITRLTNFIKEKSFFISRIIRFNLIEQNRHVKENTKYRALAFKYLLIFSLFCYYLYYLDGIFYTLQNVCQVEGEDQDQDLNEYKNNTECNKTHKLVGKDGIFNNIDENLIISISYISGFDVNLKKENVFAAGWIHIFFGALICFDVYVQKIEIYFNELSKRNRKKYRKLANINVQLKSLTNTEDSNISFNEEIKNQANEDSDKNNAYKSQNSSSKTIKSRKTIKFVIDAKNDEEERRIGEKLIESFLSIFKRATETDVQLSNSNKKYRMVQILKKIFEEIIIFLLICTAISKLNIWSFVYMILALYLIVTERSMMKYYFLYCFIIATILLQSIIIISNLNIKTDPKADEEYIKIMNDFLSIPWYKKRLNLSDERAYFLGLGVASSQIFLFWMDFIEVVIIYIYLDYFSYSVYQETNTIGRNKSKDNKINYYNLYLDTQVKNVSEKMTEFEYKKHEDCMKYNFDLQILPFRQFKYYMAYGKSLDRYKSEDTIEKNKNEINNNNISEIKLTGNDKENNDINTNLNESENNINNEENNLKPLPTYDVGNRRQNNQHLLLDDYSKAQTMRVTKPKTKSTIISDLKDKENSNNKFYNMLKQFIYLSAHNIILLLIIIISMMVSGLISVFYITFSLYFLITSTSIYLGNKYYYPKAIKRILRIGILIDISLQILYQSPLDSRDISEQNNKTTFYTVLEIIGLNKILAFNNTDEFEVIVDVDQMILVLSKAFIYLFMSFQILVYSSESFQEYYLSYIITKNYNLRRTCLMNVFKFNNERVQIMNNSIKLRQDMSKDMDKLQKTLEKWNTNIMKINENKSALTSQQKPQVNAFQNQNQQKENKIEQKNNENNKEESPLLKATSSLLLNLSKLKSEDDLNIQKKESQNDNLNINEIQLENENIKKLPIKKSSPISSNLFLSNPFEEDKNYVPKEEVLKSIKSWILGGFLVRFQIGLHKLAANYNNVTKGEKDFYERDTIQGKMETTTFIENLVDKKLNGLDLEHFTLAEMKEVKSFFDGTRDKKLAELKKQKEKEKKKSQKNNKKEITGKVNEMSDMSQKKEKLESEGDDLKKKKSFFKSKKTMRKNKTDAILPKSRIHQEKDKDNVIDLNSPKFKSLDKFKSDKLFVKYLKAGYIIRSILKDCFSFFSNNFHWVCYGVMILNHIMSASVLTLFYPISIFCYAIMEYPRPKRGYWSFCFIYTVILSTIKFIIQQKFLTTNENYSAFINNLDKLKFGLKICKSTFSKDFFIYIVFDSIVLIILLINDYLLVSKGLFKKREQQIESIYQAMERIAITKDLVITPDNIKEFNDSYLLGEKKKLENHGRKNSSGEESDKNDIIDVVHRFSKVQLNNSDFSEKESDQKENEKKVEIEKKEHKKDRKKNRGRRRTKRDEEKNKKDRNSKKEEEDENTKKKEKEKYDESKRTYFQTLFPKVRNEKPGNEYYVSYTLTMVFLIIYLLLFYTTMVQDKTYGAVTVQTKQFSGTMVIFLLIHVGFLVYDRILFISQNRNNLEYEYRLYDKRTKACLSDLEFNQIKSDITKENPNKKNDRFVIPPEYIDKLKKKYNIICIQNEEFNMPLFQKYLLQIILVGFAHIFVFFFLPMIGNYSLNGKYYCDKKDINAECNDFLDNKLILIFYFFYIIYFIGSGLQIKYGFYDMKRKSVLKSKNNSIGGGIYNGYKNVPFLYEIKLGIDWTFTSTCLDLFQWNKFESVYDILYTTNCAMNGVNSKLVGQQIGKVLKVGMGGVLSFGLIFVLVGPLMLFSSLNPTNKLNNLTSADLKLELSFTYSTKLQKNYTIFQNSKPESIESISNEDIYRFNYSNSSDTKNFPREQIQTVKFFEENDRNWDLARPHINNLIELIHYRDVNEINKIDLVIDYSFYRLLPAEAQRANKRYEKNIFSKEKYDEEQSISLSNLDHALSNCYDVNISYDNIYSPPIRLKASSHPKRVLDKKNFFDLSVQIGFVGCKNKTDSFGDDRKSYLESYFTFRYMNKTENKATNETIIKTEGIRFHVFSDKVSSTTLNYSVLTFYVTFVLLVGNYVRNFFSGQPEKISLTEMPNNEELLNLCEGIKVSRYSYNFEEEEKLYYILIEIMRSPEYLRMLTSSSIDQFTQRLKMTKAFKSADDAE